MASKKQEKTLIFPSGSQITYSSMKNNKTSLVGMANSYEGIVTKEVDKEGE